MPQITFMCARPDGRLDELLADVTDAEWALIGDPMATELDLADVADLLDISAADACEMIDLGAFGPARHTPAGAVVTLAGYAAYRDRAYPDLPCPREVAVAICARRLTGRRSPRQSVGPVRTLSEIRAAAQPARTITHIAAV